jgi:hypothetical protein
MSPSKQRLVVNAADPAAEISVVDGNLNPIGVKGIGHLDATFEAGLYKVLVRVGSHLDERLVTLDQDRDLSFAAPAIASPIPLNSSSRSHEYHVEAARAAAANVRETLGQGSSIVIFARDWTANNSAPRDNPAAGLKLLGDKDSVLSSIEARAEIRLDGDPSAGWRGEVMPGSYWLRLDLPDGTATERTLYAAAGKQTQIFLLQHYYTLADGTKIRRADIAGGTVLMTSHFDFDPENSRARLSELACYALAQTRHILSDTLLQQLLDEKFDDPILGLLGAHLLLRDHPQDTRLFHIVTNNLLTLVGPEHPDLRALWLRREDRSGIEDLRLPVPPMLRRSWDLTVEESVRNPDVIPAKSMTDAITLGVLPTAPWLVWQNESGRATSSPALSESQRTEAILADFLSTRARSDAARSVATRGAIQRVRGNLLALPGVLSRAAGRVPETGAAGGTPPPTLSENDKVEIARVLGVSGRVIDATLQKLFH